jgi:hypothetical protein
MMDEIFDRNYQAGRAEFNAGLDRGFVRMAKLLADSFEALHRVQWSAPWSHDPRHVGHA